MPLLVDGADIAAVNAEDSVVVSGAEDAVDAVAEQAAQPGTPGASTGGLARVPFVADGADARRAQRRRTGLTHRQPVHSHRVHRDRRSRRRAVSAPPNTGRSTSVETVRFADGVRHLGALGVTRFIEVGPASGLTVSVEKIAARRGAGNHAGQGSPTSRARC